MKMKFVINGVILLAILASSFVILSNLLDKGGLSSGDSSSAWIEVITPMVFELDNEGEIVKGLYTGDELLPGAIVEVRDGGFANIHFPDGSVARVSNGTKISLDEGYFEEKNGKLIVRINLFAGRVWCKVISLSTPDSSWKVTTSNAVATVRGTAFGVEFVNGNSSVIGSEDKVEVVVVDPETNKIVENTSVIIEKDNFVEIKKEDVERIKKQVIAIKQMPEDARQAAVSAPAAKELFKVRAVTREIKERDWIQKARIADEKINKRIGELKEEGLEKIEIQKKLYQDVREKFRTEIDLHDQQVQESKNMIKSADRTELQNKAEEVKSKLGDGNLKQELSEKVAPLLEKVRESGITTETIKEAVNRVAKPEAIESFGTFLRQEEVNESLQETIIKEPETKTIQSKEEIEVVQETATTEPVLREISDSNTETSIYNEKEAVSEPVKSTETFLESSTTLSR